MKQFLIRRLRLIAGGVLRSQHLWLSTCLLLVVVAAWGNTAYIHLKAQLAQILIAEAWESTQGQGHEVGQGVKPWPWADTWPVARLRLGSQDVFVLSGADGSSLAFGAGMTNGTFPPGQIGTALIGGHRDTHFSVLQTLVVGERIFVQTPDSRWLTYEIEAISIVDIDVEPAFTLSSDVDEIVLVTCYPFDAVLPGGPLRYVVRAARVQVMA